MKTTAAKRSGDSMSVVNGSMPPLSGHQRYLVGLFIQYLRSLPKWEEKEDISWTSPEYSVVNKLLGVTFRAANPLWKPQKDGEYYIGDLSYDAYTEYITLMRFAGPVEDTSASELLERRKQLLEVAREKLLAIEFIERYERCREKLGLAPDMTLPRKPATPIEKQAEATWDL